jgi:hypothetical protein
VLLLLPLQLLNFTDVGYQHDALQEVTPSPVTGEAAT